MADPSQLNEEATLNNHPQISLINTFCEITTCALKSEALFFLESHNFDLDAAVSTYLDDFTAGAAEPSAASPVSPLASEESLSPARSRSPSPPPPRASQAYNLRSSAARPNARGRGGIRTFSDLNQNDKDEDDADSDPDFDPQEHHTGSGALVQDPSKENDVDAIFDRARQLGGLTEHHSPSSSRSFSGTARLLSGEVSSTTQPPEDVIHNIVFWSNGFTVDDGPLRRLDDPENAPFLESIKRGVCPDELHPADKRTAAYVNLIRKEENYQEPKKKRIPFRGSGRTLGSTSDVTTEQSITFPLTSVTAAPTSSLRLVVDETKPTTSIQLRLADGTRLISRFNTNHTIRDIRGFIDASRPDGPRSYQLQSMGFPPKQLTDIDQTIDQAGVANSVVIQKL